MALITTYLRIGTHFGVVREMVEESVGRLASKRTSTKNGRRGIEAIAEGLQYLKHYRCEKVLIKEEMVLA